MDDLMEMEEKAEKVEDDEEGLNFWRNCCWSAERIREEEKVGEERGDDHEFGEGVDDELGVSVE